MSPFKRTTLAALAVALIAGPAFADTVALSKPNSSIVTEGLIVACHLDAKTVAAEIAANQVKMATRSKGNVKVAPGFCRAFLAEANRKAPDFLKAVRARLKPGASAESDPAVTSARKGKKETTTTTTTTTSGDTTTTTTTTVETTTNEDGSTTVSETITIRQS